MSSVQRCEKTWNHFLKTKWKWRSESTNSLKGTVILVCWSNWKLRRRLFLKEYTATWKSGVTLQVQTGNLWGKGSDACVNLLLTKSTFKGLKVLLILTKYCQCWRQFNQVDVIMVTMALTPEKVMKLHCWYWHSRRLCNTCYFYRTGVRSLVMLVTHSLTNWLTP